MKSILLIAILVIAALLYYGYPIYRASRTTDVLEAKAAAYEQHPIGATMEILVAGDSTAVGTGAARPEDSTAGRLGQDFPGANITNLSENGLKLAGLLDKLHALPDAHYDLIQVQIGANDVIGLTPLASVKSELSEVLDFAVTHASHVIVLTAGNMGLSPDFKAPLSAFISHRAFEVRSIYMDEVGKRPSARYVDLYKDAADDIFSTDIGKYYAPDLFHPSSDGYAVWYAGIRTALHSEGLL